MLEYLALETEFYHVKIDYYDYVVHRTNHLQVYRWTAYHKQAFELHSNALRAFVNINYFTL